MLIAIYILFMIFIKWRERQEPRWLRCFDNEDERKTFHFNSAIFFFCVELRNAQFFSRISILPLHLCCLALTASICNDHNSNEFICVQHKLSRENFSVVIHFFGVREGVVLCLMQRTRRVVTKCGEEIKYEQSNKIQFRFHVVPLRPKKHRNSITRRDIFFRLSQNDTQQQSDEQHKSLAICPKSNLMPTTKRVRSEIQHDLIISMLPCRCRGRDLFFYAPSRALTAKCHDDVVDLFGCSVGFHRQVGVHFARFSISNFRFMSFNWVFSPLLGPSSSSTLRLTNESGSDYGN